MNVTRSCIGIGVCVLASLAGCVSVQSGRVEDYIGPRLDGAKPAGAPTSTNQPGTTQPAAPAPSRLETPPAGPLPLGVRSAVLLAIQNNRALAVERINPAIQKTFEQQEAAAFDPIIFADVSGSRTRANLPHEDETNTRNVSADAGARIHTPSGTDISAMLEINRANPFPGTSDSVWQTRGELSVTQALLQGAGAKVNLASLRQAELDTLGSLYELRGFTLALVAEVQTTYWIYVLAVKQIEIVESALKVAERQLGDTKERIDAGRLAPIERWAAEAEVARRREDLINARSALEQTRLRLLRLVNPTGAELWTRSVTAMDLPVIPDVQLDSVEAHVQLALLKRPDLNQARLLIRRDELEIVKTKNGLLPRLDLFATLGKSGYAGSFGRSIDAMDGQSFDLVAGVRFEHAQRNRDAEARHSRARATQDQAKESLANLNQLAQVDVRSAYEELSRTREQVAATAATRKAAEATAQAEQDKFVEGRSTTLLVAQAQRDLLEAKVSEVRAVVAYLNAFVDLFRLDGSLLDRMGIVTPGPEGPERE